MEIENVSIYRINYDWNRNVLCEYDQNWTNFFIFFIYVCIISNLHQWFQLYFRFLNLFIAWSHKILYRHHLVQNSCLCRPISPRAYLPKIVLVSSKRIISKHSQKPKRIAFFFIVNTTSRPHKKIFSALFFYYTKLSNPFTLLFQFNQSQ